MNVVAASNSSSDGSKRSDSTMESSPVHQILTGTSGILADFMKGMMECGPIVSSEAFEVTFDGRKDKIFHSQSQKGRNSEAKKKKKKSPKRSSPKNRGKVVSKTHEYIHVDDMTDDEIAETWYTNDDIKKFRQQKKEERRLRKQRIQMERMMKDEGGFLEYSDGDSVYTSESESQSSSKKSVSWGGSFMSDDSDSGASDISDFSDQLEYNMTIPRATKTVLKKSQSDNNNKILLADGMAYRRIKTHQRTTMEQRRLAAMHKSFYRSGLLFRGDQNRMESFFHLSNQFDDDDEIGFYYYEEEKKTGQEDNGPRASEVPLRDLMVDNDEENSFYYEEEQKTGQEDNGPTVSEVLHDLMETNSEELKEAAAKPLPVEPEIIILDELKVEGAAEPAAAEPEVIIPDELNVVEATTKPAATEAEVITPQELKDVEAAVKPVAAEPEDVIPEEVKFVEAAAKPVAAEPEVVIFTYDESTDDDHRDHHSNGKKSKGGEENEEALFPPEALPDVTTSPTPIAKVAKPPSSPSATENRDMVVSMKPNQKPLHRQRMQYSPFASPDSFSFPSYPAAYDNPSQTDEFYEHRMDEVWEERERSSELPGLTKKFQAFRKKLLGVIKSVKAYQKAIAQMEQARSACLDECSSLIQEPPTGRVRPGTFQFAVEKSPITKLKEFAEMEQEFRAKEFQEYVLEYATRWEASVNQRVEKELKQAKKLQQSRSHYEKKVDGLRKKVNGLDAKGKDIPADLLVKLERNEIKLKDALECHEWNASRLCALIEQVTQYGWKDLLPLVSNLMKYEFNRSGGELAMYGKFPIVLESFQQPFRQQFEEEEEGNISDLD